MEFRYRPLFNKVRARLRAAPERRRVSVSAESRQVGGFETWVSERGFTLTVDQPRSFGGTDKAPKPSEYLLAALAACQEVTYRLHADALGIPLRGVSVSLVGTSDLGGFLALEDAQRAGFEAVQGTVTLDSPAPPADLQRLKEIVDRHCPVLDDLRSPVAVSPAAAGG